MNLFSSLNLVPNQNIKQYMDEAISIMENIDIYDAPIIACALAVDNDGIWTNDKHFKKQNKIKIWDTKELMFFIP